MELDPDLADAYASLGLLRHKTWEETRTGPGLEQAEAAYLKAIELNPNHATAYMWFAAVRTDEQRYNEAIALYLKALQIDPLGRIPYANLPGLYAALGRNDDALALNLKAVHIHPEWPTAFQNLSAQLGSLGRFDEALAWGLRAQAMSTDPLGGASLIGPYVEFGEFDKAWHAIVLPDDHPLYELGPGIRKIFDLDFSGAADSFEQIVANSDNPQQFMFDAIATTAMLAGDFETARTYAERRNPDFAADAAPAIDRINVSNVIRYAYILQMLGDEHRADALLAAALPVVQKLPRAGVTGHGIRDVQILALQAKPFEALAALREAIDDGFRGTVYSNGWPISLDPYLGSIRNKPEFHAMTNEIGDAVAVMQERVAQAEASGNWEALRAMADSG
jgi:tetratricopeptide (TPR) repeat protein